MKTFRIAAISFAWIIVSGSQVALQAAPNTTPKEGSSCSVGGKTGTVTIEDGNGHVWCKVGNTETECGGTPNKCSVNTTQITPPKVKSPLTNQQWNNSTPVLQQR
jgi:hypothetical protein